MAKDVDIDTSETSSYHSSADEKDPNPPAQTEQASAPAGDTERPIEESKTAKTQKKGGRKPRGGADGDAAMLDEDGGGADDNDNSTYSKFKTQNELDIEKAFQSGPKFMQLDELDEVEEFGMIRQFINQGVGMVLIEPTDPLKLFDIENMVTIEGGKKVIGFVFELVGPITAPLYSVQLYPEFVDEITAKFHAS